MTQGYFSAFEKLVAPEPQQRVVIYPPTVRWGRMFQRPHHLLTQFAKHGYESYFCPANSANDPEVYGIKQVDENLYLCGDVNLLRDEENPILYITHPRDWRVVGRFKLPFMVYDVIDDINVFWRFGESAEDMRTYDRLLTENADVITTTALKLFHDKRRQRPDTILVPNGADFSHFGQKIPKEKIPPDIAALKQEDKPIIGYYGAMARWLDYDLINHIARERPNWSIVLIGMDYDGSMKALERLPNTHYLGEKKYRDLPAYLSAFDVAMIPFRIDEITLATNPIKMYEYMSAGKPVVTTDIPETHRYRYVQTALTYPEFVAEAERALTYGQRKDYRKKLKETGRRASWKNRFRDMESAIKRRAETESSVYSINPDIVIDGIESDSRYDFVREESVRFPKYITKTFSIFQDEDGKLWLAKKPKNKDDAPREFIGSYLMKFFGIPSIITPAVRTSANEECVLIEYFEGLPTDRSKEDLNLTNVERQSVVVNLINDDWDRGWTNYVRRDGNLFVLDQSGGFGQYRAPNFNHGWHSFCNTGLLKDGDSLETFELGVKKAKNLSREKGLIEELVAKSGIENREDMAYRLRSNIRYIEHILEKFLERKWERTIEGVAIPRRFEDYDDFASWLKNYFGAILEPSEEINPATSIQRYNTMSEIVQSVAMNRFITRMRALK